MSSSPVIKAIAERRTIYDIKPILPHGVTIQTIQEIVQCIVKDTPTAFNCQSNRAIIVTGKTHHDLWDNVVKAMGDNEGSRRPASIREDAVGSVIFFVDEAVTEEMQKKFPMYKDVFPPFAEQVTGAAQIQTWTALESIGLGAHIQHFNQFVQNALPEGIPKTWTVKAQLNFGIPAGFPAEKTFIDNPIKVYN